MTSNETITREMELGMKALLTDDLNPHTFPFMLAKIAMMDRIVTKYGAKTYFPWEKKFFTKGWRLTGLAWLLTKISLFRNYKFILFLDNIAKFPRKFKPKWYLEMDGHLIYMNESDRSMRSILQDYIAVKKFFNVWEVETTQIVKDYVKLGDVCLDVGASIGYFTMLFSRLVGPTGKVFSFEPTPNQIPYIKENIRKNGYSKIAKVFNVGAWDKSDNVPLPLNAGIKYPSKCVAIDDVLESEGIMKVDFMKIDVDGPEPKVLKGLVRTFERSPDLKMVIEYYPKYITDAGLDPKEFMEVLNKYFTYEVIPGDYTDGCWNFFCKRK